MKKLSSTLLFLALLLSACGGGATATEPAATQKPAPTKTAVSASATPTPKATETVVPAREASLSDFENKVSARVSSTDTFAPASLGMNIQPSGGVETGADSRARLDLLPEGTIVRVGPNSSFTIPEVAEENSQPKTTIELLFGKIYILLNGGSLDVKTSTGVASVRGSLMRVEFDPEKKLLKASCLEGHCSLKNEKGEMVELVAGESTYIQGSHAPIDPILIDSDEIQEWLDEVPELADFLDVLPNPADYPDPNQNDNGGNDNNNNNNNDDDDDSGNGNGGYPNP
jgi:hypothetical protein